jgi:hypothetical protein
MNVMNGPERSIVLSPIVLGLLQALVGGTNLDVYMGLGEEQDRPKAAFRLKGGPVTCACGSTLESDLLRRCRWWVCGSVRVSLYHTTATRQTG